MLSRADTHLHTYYSGYSNYRFLKFPESVTKPEEMVEIARGNGINTLCVTDHDAVKGAFIAKEYARKYDDFTVIIGEEVMTTDGEILAYGLNEKVEPMMTAEETLDVIRSQDALAVAPHPYGFYVSALGDKIFDLDLDGIEVINGGHVDRFTNHHAQHVFRHNPGKWAALSGSDAHSKYTAGYNWTEYEGFGEEDFRNAIKQKRTIPCGYPAPVFQQIQWSLEVVVGGQKMLTQALFRKLESDPDNPLTEKMVHMTDLKKIAGLLGGLMYCIPPIPFAGAIAATTWLHKQSKRLVYENEYKEEGRCPKKHPKLY